MVWFKKAILDNINLESIVSSLIVIAIFIIIILVLRFIYHRWMKVTKDSSINRMSSIIWGIIKFLLVLICVITVLEINGVDVTSTIAGLGIASAVVGLALQDAMKDIIMGIHIVTDKFFQVGDYVYYNEELHRVETFSLKTTKLYNIDNPGYVYICNRQIEVMRVATDFTPVTVPVSYTAPMEKVDAVLKQACEKAQKIEGVKQIQYAGLQELGESSMDYKIKLYCDPDRRPIIRRAVLRVIKEEMDAAGIEVPFNQMDVHLDKM